MFYSLFLFLTSNPTSNEVKKINIGMDAKDWITILVPATVTLIGFIITYFTLTKSFKDEIRKQKSNIALEKMATVPYETLDFYEVIGAPLRLQKQIDAIKNTGQLSQRDEERIRKLHDEIEEVQKSLHPKMVNLYNTIYAYGSIEAIKIVSSMQRHNYNLKAGSSEEEKWIIMAHMILLASQVKKDVTNIIVNPQQWFEMKITDYQNNKERFDPIVNSVIDDLKLDERFKIVI